MMEGTSNFRGMVMIKFKILTIGLLALSLLPSPPAFAANGIPLHFYHHYEIVLDSALDKQGRVHYSSLKIQRRLLDQVLFQFESLSPSAFSHWKPKDQMAFYINAYNARVLQMVVDHYPLKSIQDIPVDWSALVFPLLGRSMTLKGVEEEVLEKPYADPRVCLALVPASRGGPVLRNRPYYGSQLDSLLEEQAWRFFKRPEEFNIDRIQNVVYLSPILRQHAGDFMKLYGTSRFTFLDEKNRAVLNFVSQHVNPRDRDYLNKTPAFSLKYLEEDWSLNDSLQ
jgi:hypothetical protein